MRRQGVRESNYYTYTRKLSLKDLSEVYFNLNGILLAVVAIITFPVNLQFSMYD